MHLLEGLYAQRGLNTMIDMGGQMPELELAASDGSTVRLNDFAEQGKKTVLYFYPKDNTSGCTLEALEFEALKTSFEAMGAVVMGISRDSVKSHLKFIENQNLNFLLLSDPEQLAHQHFGVMKAKKMYGKDVVGVERSTFVFDEKGSLVLEFRGVKAAGHAQRVLDALSGL
jgi:peroxiredoxin Q/BCP